MKNWHSSSSMSAALGIAGVVCLCVASCRRPDHSSSGVDVSSQVGDVSGVNVGEAGSSEPAYSDAPTDESTGEIDPFLYQIQEEEEEQRKAKADFDDVASSGKVGQDLIDAKREWARMVMSEVDGIWDFSDLLDFLEERGEGDLREWMLGEGLAEAAVGPNGSLFRRWLKDQEAERSKLAEQAGYSIGRGFLGDEEGLKAYLATFTNDHIQSAVLTGYTIAYAASHPEEAISKFLSLRPGKVDTSGITQVMAALPPDTDFVKAGSGIPSDDQTLAKTARAAMLVNWAGTAPRDAAQYVMANTSKVHADQLGGIMEKWYTQEPLEAARWAASLRTPEHRDAALAGEARAFAKEDLGRAWDAAGRISDLDRRIAAATPVYRIWSGRDPEGARQAWEQMFGE